jgi:hypothetical protein
MTFAGVSYVAIFIAAVAGFLVGFVWYGPLFSKPWRAANNLTSESMHARGGSMPMLLILTFVALLVMAWVLAGLIAHLGPGQVTLKNGVISAVFCWIGFVITTMVVNNAFAGRKGALTLIDGGHWLVVLIVQGAIIGWWGV